MSCDVSQLKRAAAKCWPSILSAVGGIPRELLDGRHHPCPKCGGTDRFRLLDESSGAVICNRCFKSGNGDGISAVMWRKNVDFQGAIEMIANNLGLSNGKPKRKRVSARERLAKRGLRIPVDGKVFRWSWLKGVGATKDTHRITVPCYGSDRKQCSELTIHPVGEGRFRKGLLAKGKPAGVFLPHEETKPRFPQPGEKWLVVEGPKDAAALQHLGENAVGLPTCQLNAKFASLLAGCHVTVVPDLDAAGQQGSRDTAARLHGVAASVRIARLPGTIAESKGRDVRDVLAERDGETKVRRAIVDAQLVGRDGEPVDEISFRRFTAAELDALDVRVEYLVENILAKNHVAGIVGASKTLKTNIACDLALSLATRGKFLGYFPTTRASRVLFMSGESGLPTIQETLRRIARAAGVSLRDAENLIVSDQLPILSSRLHVDAMARLLEAERIEVLMVDPLYLASGDLQGRESSLFAMGNVLRPLAEVCQTIGTTLVIVHHATQGSNNKGGLPRLEDSSWAGTQQFFRQWIALKRSAQYDPDQPGHHELLMVAGGSMGHTTGVALTIDEGSRLDPNGRKWDVTVSSISEAARNTAKPSARKDAAAVLEALADFPRGATANQLREHCRMSGTRIKQALALLEGDERIAGCDVRVSNQNTPRPGWKKNAD